MRHVDLQNLFFIRPLPGIWRHSLMNASTSFVHCQKMFGRSWKLIFAVVFTIMVFYVFVVQRMPVALNMPRRLAAKKEVFVRAALLNALLKQKNT